jgi:beta-mannosidase
MVPGSAWAPWEDVSREFGPIADDPAELPNVVKASRYLQAESYRYAVENTRRRHPQCTGFLVWMGHDTMHCTSNNSIVQIDGSVKPAYDWFQAAFAPCHISLKHDRITYEPGDRFVGQVWLCRDDDLSSANGTVMVRMRSLTGEIIESSEQAVSGDGASIPASTVDWPVQAFDERLFVIELIWRDGDETVENRYLLSQNVEHPLMPLKQLPIASLKADWNEGAVVVSNVDIIAAISVRAIPAECDKPLLTSGNNVILFPAESRSIQLHTSDSPLVEIEAYNSETIKVAPMGA